MSAEAVFDVRSGLRTALALARRPATRNIGAIGRPRVPATGTATTGLSRATPMNTARAPMPEQRDDGHGLVGDPEPRDDEAGSEEREPAT